ncbi:MULTISPECIES: VOC family protein [unclassified Streptomyces]|uniref:VOC family protein n=1 Tax=unclassified Streptomyces TaxID=2593676 RepID=UPI000DD9CC67|nr:MULTISPECIES: VOC family protein [unclassified Streptomyces]QZZ25303.1 VOC family protein [Streptomyces sp. ST1015]
MAGPTFPTAWIEFGTDKPDEVKEFYGEMFGWTYARNTDMPGVNYHAALTPGGELPAGGVWESEGKFENYAIFYILVPDVQEAVTRAEGVGAKVLMPQVTDASGFSFARLEDTAGNHFGVYAVPAP